MMYCRRCGAENPDNAKFCAECGERLDVAQSPNQYSNNSQSQYPYPPQPQPQYVPPYYQNNMYLQEAAANSAATSAMVCGIIGLFIAPPIFGIIALAESNKAKKLGYTGGKATAGLVLGMIEVIGSCIMLILITAIFRLI